MDLIRATFGAAIYEPLLGQTSTGFVCSIVPLSYTIYTLSIPNAMKILRVSLQKCLLSTYIKGEESTKSIKNTQCKTYRYTYIALWIEFYMRR